VASYVTLSWKLLRRDLVRIRTKGFPLSAGGITSLLNLISFIRFDLVRHALLSLPPPPLRRSLGGREGWNGSTYQRGVVKGHWPDACATSYASYTTPLLTNLAFRNLESGSPGSSKKDAVLSALACCVADSTRLVKWPTLVGDDVIHGSARGRLSDGDRSAADRWNFQVYRKPRPRPRCAFLIGHDSLVPSKFQDQRDHSPRNRHDRRTWYVPLLRHRASLLYLVSQSAHKVNNYQCSRVSYHWKKMFRVLEGRERAKCF